HFAVNPAPAESLEYHAGARRQLLARMHQGLPDFGRPAEAGRYEICGVRHSLVGRHAAHQQTFDSAASRLAPAEQARGKHPRVVEDQDIARIEKIDEAVNCAVRTKASAAIEMEQTGRAADRRRVLRDE